MHICFIIGEMNFSGAEKVLSIVANELSIREHEISIILLKDKYGSVNKYDNYTTYGVNITNANRISRIFRRLSNIRKMVCEISPDVIVSFGYVCNVNSISSLFNVKIPLIVCERNDPKFDPRKFMQKFSRWILYRFASGYVFQTERIKKYFDKSIQKRAVVIPNPIIDTGIRWNIDKCKKSIITVARLDDFQKDQVVMFKAFKEFSKTNPEYTLDVYGDGPDKQTYISIIHELEMEGKIILHGKSANPLQEVQNSEIFLLTSKFEGMPNALMEALSIGIPSVSTDCGGGGAAELCNMVDAGIIVPVGDITAISTALDDLSHDDEKKSRFSNNSVRINNVLSKDVVTVKWENFLQTFLK